MPFAMSIPEEMRKKYLERRQRDLQELTNAASVSDPGPFVKVGHQLKGNAVTFGYQELAELGVRMEEAGQSKNWEEARACLDTLRTWVEKHGS